MGKQKQRARAHTREARRSGAERKPILHSGYAWTTRTGRLEHPAWCPAINGTWLEGNALTVVRIGSKPTCSLCLEIVDPTEAAAHHPRKSPLGAGSVAASVPGPE